MNCSSKRPGAAMCILLALLLGTCSLAGCRGAEVVKSTAEFPSGTGFVRIDVPIDGTSRPLWVFIPRNYDSKKSYPAIVFLHGLFEAGDADSRGCLTGGLGPVIARDPDAWPFITIFPQSDGTWRGEPRQRLVIESLQVAQQRWSIDPDRIVLAGLSFGGLGTWEIGAKYSGRFAALVPVAGFGAPDLADELASVPVWAFAMQTDPVVDSERSQTMRDAIASHGGTVRLTEFPGVGHDCWDRAVAESELVPWMLRQRRSSRTPVAVTE